MPLDRGCLHKKKLHNIMNMLRIAVYHLESWPCKTNTVDDTDMSIRGSYIVIDL